ncbi:MAG: DUF58 domain-containing protein [Planctomycetaceae bacterium]
MVQSKRFRASRPVPLIGFLCLMAGGGVLYSAPNISGQFGDHKPHAAATFGVIGIFLLLWGVRLIAVRFAPAAGSRVNRLNRNRVMLPREGMMYLLNMIVAFVGSLIGRNNMLMLVFSIMAGPFILNGWITFTLLKRNRVHRRLPERAMAGEVIPVELTLNNRKFWFSSWLMVVRDRLRHESRLDDPRKETEALEPAVLFASVRPRKTRSACYELELNRRGRYFFGPLEVSTRFPIGLVERGFITPADGELIVHPRVGRMTDRWRRDSQLASEMMLQHRSRAGSFDDEFHHLREFRQGDSQRSIHWRTSARLNELMVREFEQNRDRGLLMVVELWLPDSPQPRHFERVELAISFAATACVEHLMQTRSVQQNLLITGAEITSWQAGSTSAAVNSVLDVFALAEPGEADGLQEVLKRAQHGQSSLRRMVFVTTRPPGSLPEEKSVLESLPGVEIFHALPKELAAWFISESTVPTLLQSGRQNTYASDAAGDLQTPPSDPGIQGQLVAVSRSQKQRPIQGERSS